MNVEIEIIILNDCKIHVDFYVNFQMLHLTSIHVNHQLMLRAKQAGP